MLAVLSTALLAAGCAKREPPSGGPPDIEPPRIVETSPDSGAAGIALDAPISITFSEGMEPRSTADAVTFAPPIEIRNHRWKKRTLSLVPEDSLERDRTYTMFVANMARDRHGNTMRTGTAIIFSTADSFPPGRVEGEIEARGMAAAGIYLWGYDADSGAVPDSTARDFDALGQGDPEGRFRIDGLAVPGRYTLWAFADLNGNRSFEPDVDVLALIDTTLSLSVERPVASGLTVRVLNPRAPANVGGDVVDSTDTADSTAAEAKPVGSLSVLARDVADSTRTFAQTADEDGAFEIELPAGTWVLRGFRDLNRNGSWDVDTEPASEPVTFELGPADEVRDIQFVVTRDRAR